MFQDIILGWQQAIRERATATLVKWPGNGPFPDCLGDLLGIQLESIRFLSLFPDQRAYQGCQQPNADIEPEDKLIGLHWGGNLYQLLLQHNTGDGHA